MPKRILDGEAMWESTKISDLPEWMIPEYAWFHPLADSKGSFEITNLRVIWVKVAAIRPNLTLENVQEIVRAFHEHGLLFIWEHESKRYAHWTGSEKPGRLPQPARRTKRYGPILAPDVPTSELQGYVTQVRQQKCRNATQTAAPVLVLDWVRDRGKTSSSEAKGASDPATGPSPSHPSRKPNSPPSDAGLRLAQQLQDRIRANNPNSKITQANISSWAGVADLMIRRDGRTEQQISDLIDWSQRDHFWSSNVLSMAKLREKFDQLTLKKKGGTNGSNDGRSGTDPNEQTRFRIAAAGLTHP